MANEIEKQCDELRAEMGFIRQCLTDCARRFKHKPSAKLEQEFKALQNQFSQAQETYRSKCLELFARAA